MIYSFVTAIIEVPAILMLYSYGYPSNPSSYMTWAFLIAYNLFFIMIGFSSVGGPIPGQGPRDMSLDLVWGAISMFIIIAAIGETMNWLTEEVRKLRRKQ
jgi:hypothetical protein